MGQCNKETIVRFIVAFNVKGKDTEIAPGHSYLDCHLIFGIKMIFTRNDRFVVNGSTTPITSASKYSGVVSRETVRIAFKYASFNELYIMTSDIHNDYLQAPISEKYWTILGPEFGTELQVCKAYVVRSLYGTCCAGRDFSQYLRECMKMLGYTSCLADSDLWIRKAVNDNGCE